MKPIFNYLRIGCGCPSFGVWGKNDNNFYNRLHIPLSGKALLSNNDKFTQVMEPGYAYLLPSCTDLSLSECVGEEYVHLYIDVYVSPLVVSKNPRVMKLDEDNLLTKYTQTFQAILENVDAEGEIILNKGTLILPNYFKLFLDSMLVYIFERYDVKMLHDNMLDKAIRYIYEHYSEDISNEDIASNLHVHSRHLIRIFKDVLKKTPRQFLNEYRIAMAKSMLVEEKSVKEVCYACGFNSPKNFGVVFKRVTGELLSDFLKSIKSTEGANE